MDYDCDTIDWQSLSLDEKKKQFFLKQKTLLDAFMKRNAISSENYETSLNGLRKIMEI